jgi:secondary thiamine-phosphate synthase enzyme
MATDPDCDRLRRAWTGRTGATSSRFRSSTGTYEKYGAGVKSTELVVRTGSRRGLFDLTGKCAAFVAGEGDGLLNVFVPHATAGVVVVELGSGSDEDVTAALDALLPRDDRWRHHHGSPGHGADHVLPLLASPSLGVPVIEGTLALGTWQSIALLDPNPDNDRRTVRLTFLEG